MIRRALTIAGSDSGGGAGIQADLKTFAALGVHGMSVITSITAQNTYEVRAVHDVPLDVIEAQFKAVVEDIGVDAAKTGMLSNSEIIRLIASLIKKYDITLVVDPVMIAKSGAPLLRDDAVEVLAKELIPLATVVTPNKPEAERLSGISISGLDDSKLVAKKLSEELGARAVVVKGGHLAADESIDILYYEGRYYEFRAPRIQSRNTHGTGCSFSAAITAELAKGRSIPDAVRTAKEFITVAIEYGLSVGRGHGPVNPSAWVLIPAEKYAVLSNLKDALKLIELNGRLIARLIPESQMNIAMALPGQYLRSIRDVASVPGRIVRVGEEVRVISQPEFGVDNEVSELLSKLVKVVPEIRALANIMYCEGLEEIINELGYGYVYLDYRAGLDELRQAVKAGQTLDIIFDKGSWGREAMTYVLGRDAVEVANKLINIAVRYKRNK